MTKDSTTPSPVDEQLSAWLDDELPGAELELLATRLTQSPELQARLARYALIGSRLRGDRPGPLAGELAALHLHERVRLALDDAPETARPVTGRQAAPRWLPYAAAAGVVAIAIAIAPQLRTASGPAIPVAQQVAEPAFSPATAGDARWRKSADWVGSGGNASLSSTRLTSYLVYHGEFSGVLSAKVSDSHIVSHRPYAIATTSLGDGRGGR